MVRKKNTYGRSADLLVMWVRRIRYSVFDSYQASFIQYLRLAKYSIINIQYTTLNFSTSNFQNQLSNTEHPASNTQHHTSGIKHLSTTLILAALAILTSCTKNLDDFGPQTEGGDIPVPTTERIIILNEGNFMFGNGTVSVINNVSDEVAQEVFKTKNGFPLGDVPQSMLIHDSLAYIIVNNSGKIEVVKNDNFESVKTITGFTSPRQMVIVNQSPLTAWITDLYANKIWKVNLESGAITGSIISNGWSENIIRWNGNVLILNKKDSVINVFDINAGQKIKTIGTGLEIVDFRLWSTNELMILTNTGIFKLQLQTMNLETVQLFASNRTPSKMAVDTVHNEVYFLESDVYKYKTSVEKVITPNSGSNFYGMEVNSLTGEVFITDAKDYVQPGDLIKYSSDYNDPTVYRVGVNPQFLVVQ
jgi:hypothetical protein